MCVPVHQPENGLGAAQGVAGAIKTLSQEIRASAKHGCQNGKTKLACGTDGARVTLSAYIVPDVF
jgi:hypothetical protein